MEIAKYKNIETENLRKKKKTYLIIAIATLFVSVLLIVAAFYFISIDDNSTATILALVPAIVTIWPPIILGILIGRIETELKSRRKNEHDN